MDGLLNLRLSIDMDRKLSSSISPVGDKYAVSFTSWTIGEDGQRENVVAMQDATSDSYLEAATKVETLINELTNGE